MKKINKWNFYLLSIILAVGTSTLSYAEPHTGHGDDGNKKSMDKSHHQSKKGGHGKKHGKGGTFSPHWVKTLTEEQKISFDKMHLMVGQFEAVQKAKMKMLKAELNVMAAQSPTNQTELYKKIDEILNVKKGIMRNRFDHITEMRNELTEQQRISYDMGILSRGKHKH